MFLIELLTLELSSFINFSMKKTLSDVIDFFGLALIASLSLCYILFGVRFAETHIQFAFLNFPVFIGEIVLFFGIVLLIWKIFLQKQPFGWKKLYYLVLFYIVYVLSKTVYGYFHYGPLALRHSALFYYPAYAFLVFNFYNRKVLQGDVAKSVIVVFLCVITKFSGYYECWSFSLFLLSIGLTLLIRDKKIKVVLLFLDLLMADYVHFFRISRMIIVGNIVTVLFLFFYFYSIVRLKNRLKVSFLIFTFFLIGTGFYKFADRNALKSLVSVDYLMEDFKKRDALIKEREKSFIQKDLSVGLYNPNRTKLTEDVSVLSQANAINVKSDVSYREVQKLPMPVADMKQGDQPQKEEPFRDDSTIPSVQKEDFVFGEVIKDEAFSPRFFKKVDMEDRNLDVALGNAVFRLLIWRDVFREIFSKRHVFGFSFGKPFRSRSIEILNMAVNEWQRDGWIAIHNSYIHFLYRAGLIGVLVILFLVVSLFRIARSFGRRRYVFGGLILASVLPWFIAANFLVVLEVPYMAIPIWSLFGAVYAHSLNAKGTNCENIDCS